MRRRTGYPIFFMLLLFQICGLAQTRSTNIQQIDGKKYYIHRIEKSQSLYGISKIYNVSIDELYKQNPELKAGAKVNQEIRIPVVAAAPMAGATASASQQPAIDTLRYICHRVSKGETVYSLTRKFNLSEKELLSYNPGLSAGVREGQVIIVGERNRKKGPSKEAKEIRQIFTAREKPASVMVDSNVFKPVLKPRKTNYNISLVLPFSLKQTLEMDMTELVKANGNFPAIPALAVDFYLGFRRAADSLSDASFKPAIRLFDVDDKDSLRLRALLGDPVFMSSDLVFGPLYADEFKTVSKKAKELAIPIVSPITQQNKILYNNIYISKTNPSQFTLMESLADYCLDSLSPQGAHVIVMTLNDKDKKEAGFVSAFKKYYNEKQKASAINLRDTLAVAKGMAGLKTAFRPNVRNVIVSLSNNAVYTTDFTTQLAMFADKRDVVLCGWQNITELDNIDQAYLEQLHYTFPHQFNLTNTASYGKLCQEYRENQQTSPSEYFFMGFDIAYYYLKNLKELGPDFVHSLDQHPAETNYMRFQFTRPDFTTGFDNRGVYIFRYQDLHLYKTGWK